jgi:hypothetical protein
MFLFVAACSEPSLHDVNLEKLEDPEWCPAADDWAQVKQTWEHLDCTFQIQCREYSPYQDYEDCRNRHEPFRIIDGQCQDWCAIRDCIEYLSTTVDECPMDSGWSTRCSVSSWYLGEC